MENEVTLQIKSKVIIWFSVSIIFFVAIMIGLNKLDDRRKYKQFKSLNEEILASEYPERLAGLFKAFAKSDSSASIKIRETLTQLKSEFKDISDCKIFLSDSSTFLEFNCDEWYTEMKYLPKNIETLKIFLDKQNNVDLEQLFELVQSDKKYVIRLLKLIMAIFICWKIEINMGAFLRNL